MNKMKKSLAILCMLTMAFMLFACGLNQEKSTENKGYDRNQTSNDTGAKNTGKSREERTGQMKLVVSINPEVEFDLDEDGKIIAFTFNNADAEEAYAALNLLGLTVEEAMELVVNTATDKGYMKEGHAVTISLDGAEVNDTDKAYDTLTTARDATKAAFTENGMEADVIMQVTNSNPSDEDCDLCFGVGVATCDLCGGKSNGTGLIHCDSCNGIGQITCDLCGGTGWHEDSEEGVRGVNSTNVGETCRNCGGTGIEDHEPQTCYVCYGTGLCINCGGSGQEADDQGVGACHACGGSGDCLQQICDGGVMRWTQQCGQCGGTGIADAGGHDGNHDGEHNDDERPAGTCNRCDGHGVTECNSCDQETPGYCLCNRCNGELVMRCPRCDGSGKR